MPCETWRASYCNFSSFGGYLQAFWRGFSLRRRLKAALATVPVSDMDEDDFFEEDVFEELDAFFLKQVCRMRYATDKIGNKKSFSNSGKC